MTTRTPADVPPSYRVVYHETFETGPGAWTVGKAREGGSWHRNFFGEPGEGEPAGWRSTGGRTGGVAYSEPPWYFDDNHGEFAWLYLAFILGEKAWRSRPEVQALHNRDLRDALIRLTVRGRDFRTNGTRLLYWIQGEANHGTYKPSLYRPGHPLVNWALSSQPIGPELEDGEWHDLELRLVPDETQWSQMGLINGGLARKIRVIQSLTMADGTLDSILDGHYYALCGFLLCYVDANNPPTGRIEFDQISVAVRQ